MRKRDLRISNIKAIEREFETALAAIQLLDAQMKRDPSHLRQKGLDRKDYQQLTQNLALTYTIRLYAEFEACLRDVWKTALAKKSHPPSKDLIESLARRYHLPQSDFDRMEDLRKSRNSFVHEDAEEGSSFSFGDARAVTCRFLSHLPPDW